VTAAALLPLASIVAVWWVVTLVQIGAARRRATDVSRTTERLLLDALDPIPPASLYNRLAATAKDSLGARRVVVFAAELRDGQETWTIPFLSSASQTQVMPTAGLLTIASEQAVVVPELVARDDRPEVGAVSALFTAYQLDVIVWLYRDGVRALLVGMRLGPMTPQKRAVLEHWRVCGSAIMQAQTTHGGNSPEVELANEADVARFLASTVLSEPLDARSDLDWVVRFYTSDAAPHFLMTYRPTATMTVVVFGRPIATGVAASLVNVAIKSCCDAMMEHLGESVSWQALGQRLNHFLWQPKNPVGVHCHILLIDREAEVVELASAGTSTLFRVPAGEVDPADSLRVTCAGQPLGTSIEGTWRVATLSLAAGDGFLACTEGTGPAPALPAKRVPDAESLIDAATIGGIAGGCLLAVVVR
jgi:hypothetical protein